MFEIKFQTNISCMAAPAGNWCDEEVTAGFGVQEENTEVQILVDFAKKDKMAAVNTSFQI